MAEENAVERSKFSEIDVNKMGVRKDGSTGESPIHSLADIYHENSKGRINESRQFVQGTENFDTEEGKKLVANIHRDFPAHERIELPSPDETLSGSLQAVFDERRSVRTFSERPTPLSTLSNLLDRAISPNRSVRLETGDRKQLRPYPSAGGLYPVQIYVIAVDVRGLDSGVYFYQPEAHAVRQLKEISDTSELPSLFYSSNDVFEPNPPNFIFALTGLLGRSKAKYGDRGYRFVLQESGHIAQNILLASQCLSLAAVPYGGFKDDELTEYIGADTVDEPTVYTVIGGERDE